MRKTWVWLAALAVVALVGRSILAQEDKTPPVLVIDGAKNPEAFPEWFIWTLTFSRMGRTADRIDRGEDTEQEVAEELGISLQGLRVLLGEARSYLEKEAKELAKYQQRVTSMRTQKKTEDEILGDLQALEMEFRFEALEGGARAMASFDALGRANLQRWILDHIVRTATVKLRGSEIARFRLPR